MAGKVDGIVLSVFNGSNFDLWKKKMEIFFRGQKMLAIVDGSDLKPAIGTTQFDKDKHDTWVAKDAKAHSYLMQALSDEQNLNIMSCQSSSEAWLALRLLHNEVSEVSVHFRMKEYMQFVMEDGMSVSEFWARVTMMAQKLRDLGEEISDKQLVCKILCSVPDGFHNVISIWDSLGDNKKTLAELKARLLNEERLIDGFDKLRISKDGEQHAMAAKYGGHRNRFAKSKTSGAKADWVKSADCRNCGIIGHLWRDCRKPLKEKVEAEEQRQDGIVLT